MKTINRLNIVTVLLGMLIFSPLSDASSSSKVFEPYSDTRFALLQTMGKTIVLDVHADWCGTCKVQGPILDKIVSEHQNEGVVGLKLNYDKMTPVQRQRLNVHKQSTVIIFKGAHEVARTIGERREDKLRDLIRKGV